MPGSLRWSMKSFAVRIEPAAQPRLAAAVLFLYLAAAALPWLARCPPGLAAPLSVAALIGLAATLSGVPGPHCRLRRLVLGRAGCRIWLASGAGPVAAKPGTGCRVYSALIAIELQSEAGRLRWLLPRGALPPPEFRRLKARLRLAC